MTEIGLDFKAARANIFVGNELFAEDAPDAYRTTTPTATLLRITDQVGTLRAREGIGANWVGACSSLPHGDAMNCTVDPSDMSSTGKERDAESGLDYFGARFYGSSIGRFLSPAPGPYIKQDPQTWNRYAYARNSPLKYIDPTGRYFVVATGNTSVQQYISTLLRSESGKAFVQLIASDPRPTKVNGGRLDYITNSDRSFSITNGATTPIPDGKALGSTDVVLDPVNQIFTSQFTGKSIFQVGLTAFAHELEHVSDENAASSFSDAIAAGVAGDARIGAGEK
jgi:RHS repeat-associated protein